jgi:hypothetical protein
LGERGTEEIATEWLEAHPIVGRNPDVGVEIEAVEGRLARAAGDPALDGGADEAGQHRRHLGERVGRSTIVAGLQMAAGEPLPHTRADGGDGLSHVRIARWGRGVTGEATRARVAADAVEHKRMEVDVKVQAAPEALDHGQRSALAVLDAIRTRGARVKATRALA